MVRVRIGKSRSGAAIASALLLPLLALPLLIACADSSPSRNPCERPASCADKRPLPILY
jgi:hypothetical protein